jgi:hypothetical protein
MNSPKLLQSYLFDGTIEGVRIIELSESSVKAFVIPRLKLNDVKNRDEINWPSLYFLINSGDNQLYIGESENFYNRVKNHDQSKDFWDMAIAIVSNTNNLEKSDVKYLESLAVEKAQTTAAMEVLNKTIPARNNVHEFKVHTLEKILDDTALIADSLGFSFFASKKDIESESIWNLTAKKSNAKAQYRGDKFIILAGSVIDKSFAPSWAKAFPKALLERGEIISMNGRDDGDIFYVTSNIATRSPNHAASLVTGRSVNAWVTWKDENGKTMDEIMRKDIK